MSEITVEPIERYGLSAKGKPKALFSKVGIVGCGSVGQTIARIISSKGIEVIFLEISQEKINQAMDGIENELKSMINRWGMTENEMKAIMSRIKGTLNYEDFNGCDLVLEAILSKSKDISTHIRKEIFKKVEQHVAPHCIIATNSASVPITELASELQYKDRCISLHFSTTSAEAQIIEIAKGLHTSDEVCDNVEKFVKLIGRIVIPADESPGLISIRLFAPLINEACRILMEGVGTKEDIDMTMRNGFGLQFGPFEMADKVGLDKIVQWMDNLYDEFGDIRYKASPIIKKLVRAQRLGRKTGHGFYEYDENEKPIKQILTI